MLGFDDIAKAHSALDAKLGAETVAVFETGNGIEQANNIVSEAYGVNAADILQVAQQYGIGAMEALPMMLAKCHGDEMATFHATVTSAFYQGFIVALATILEQPTE